MDREIRRKVVHITTAVIAVPLFLLLPLAWALGLGAASILVIGTSYTLRRKGRKPPKAVEPLHDGVSKALSETMRPYELFPWSPILYIVGGLTVATLSDVLSVPMSLAFASYAFLGFGDAASALVGKAYGSIKLPWNPRKSLEGTVAGIGAAFPWAVLFATGYHAVLGTAVPFVLYPIILVGSIVGMLAETFPGEDNLTIPLVSWFVMLGMSWPLGLWVPS